MLVAQTDLSSVIDGIAEYTKRLKHYAKFNIKALPTLKNIKNLSIEMQKKKESEFIESAIDTKSRVILLDEIGTEYSSPNFAKWLNKQNNSGMDLTFIIGGAYGFSNEMRRKYQ